jgi:hypothetical protein
VHCEQSRRLSPLVAPHRRKGGCSGTLRAAGASSPPFSRWCTVTLCAVDGTSGSSTAAQRGRPGHSPPMTCSMPPSWRSCGSPRCAHCRACPARIPVIKKRVQVQNLEHTTSLETVDRPCSHARLLHSLQRAASVLARCLLLGDRDKGLIGQVGFVPRWAQPRQEGTWNHVPGGQHFGWPMVLARSWMVPCIM